MGSDIQLKFDMGRPYHSHHQHYQDLHMDQDLFNAENKGEKKRK